MSDDQPLFDDCFRAKLHRLFAWRRDVRHFRRDPIAPETLTGLIETACSAPSVGLSQPWRFVIVEDQSRRRSIIDEFRHCNAAALHRYSGEMASRYARLKLAGLEEAPVHLAVFAERGIGQGHGLGRLTMPETADYSVVAAIVTLWLAARAEGIGVGWVSILRPERMPEILSTPRAWRFIAYLCLGYAKYHFPRPELEQEGWEARRPTATFIVRR